MHRRQAANATLTLAVLRRRHQPHPLLDHSTPSSSQSSPTASNPSTQILAHNSPQRPTSARLYSPQQQYAVGTHTGPCTQRVTSSVTHSVTVPDALDPLSRRSRRAEGVGARSDAMHGSAAGWVAERASGMGTEQCMQPGDRFPSSRALSGSHSAFELQGELGARRNEGRFKADAHLEARIKGLGISVRSTWTSA